MTEDEAMDVLQQFVNSKPRQKDAAGALGIGAAYLSDVLHGRRDPGPVLERLGFARIVTYEKGDG